jgi:hypothetical protein
MDSEVARIRGYAAFLEESLAKNSSCDYFIINPMRKAFAELFSKSDRFPYSRKCKFFRRAPISYKLTLENSGIIV